jgi:hypothetical protein
MARRVMGAEAKGEDKIDGVRITIQVQKLASVLSGLSGSGKAIKNLPG